MDLEEVTEPTEADAFDEAFAEAAGEPGTLTEPAAEPAATEPVTTEPVTAPAATEPAATEPAATESAATEPVTAPAATEPATEPTTAPAATVEPAPQLTPEALAEAIVRAQAKATPAPAPAAEPAQPREVLADDFLDAPAKAAIAKFEAEWPDEFAAVNRMLESQIQARMANELNQFAKQVNSVLAPLYQSVGTVEVNTYWAEVHAAHPDAKQLVPALQAWIAEQSPLYRAPLEAALRSGKPGEAVELLSLYKQATGQTGAAPATPAPSAAQVTTTPPVKTATPPVAALLGVPSAQRPKPTSGADKNDYDAAFEEALGVINS